MCEVKEKDVDLMYLSHALPVCKYTTHVLDYICRQIIKLARRTGRTGPGHLDQSSRGQQHTRE